MYRCPKEGQVDLVEGPLSADLKAYCCESCGGAWIAKDTYRTWRQQQPASMPTLPERLPTADEVQFQPAPFDSRAALCPACRHYMVRGRVNLQDGMFFVERCPNCEGIWCDGGEWDVLQRLGLDTHIEDIFSGDWQAQMRALGQAERERQALQEKMGPELAAQIFELADQLEQHPNGDFGVAYLMRRFGE